MGGRFRGDALDPTRRGCMTPLLCSVRQHEALQVAHLGMRDGDRRFLNSFTEKHQILLRRIPLVGDVQVTWLFLVQCAGARANPRRWNHLPGNTMKTCCSVSVRSCAPTFWIGTGDEGHRDVANVIGRPGSPQRSPHLSCLPMIHGRPAVAAALVGHLENCGTPYHACKQLPRL